MSFERTALAHKLAIGRMVALGYVHRDSAEVGRRLTLGSGLELDVTALAS